MSGFVLFFSFYVILFYKGNGSDLIRELFTVVPVKQKKVVLLKFVLSHMLCKCKTRYIISLITKKDNNVFDISYSPIYRV